MVLKIRGWVKILLIVLMIVFIVIVVKSAITVYHDFVYPKKYQEYVTRYAQEFDVEENLIYAVIKAESGFNPDAVSVDDARGLMQITPNTFDWIATKLKTTGQNTSDDLFDPEMNIQYGTFFLSYLEKEFTHREVMLSAYHAGRGITNKWLADEKFSTDGETLNKIPYKETSHYVDKVLMNYKKYNSIYKEKDSIDQG